jgi:hypothetical protein
MSGKNKLPTNWSDGMKIGRQHFIDSETAIFGAIHAGAGTPLTNYNYGLLLPESNRKSSLELEVVKSQADNFLIKLTVCRAITSGGILIDLNPENSSELTLNDRIDFAALKNVPNPVFYLLLSVDYSVRVPFGTPSPDENPARHPFAGPAYQLHVLEAGEVNHKELGSNHICIGRFKIKSDDLIWDTAYIPPSSKVQGFPLLRQHYNSVANHFNNIQTSTYSIIQKVLNKNQNSPLAFNIKHVCEKIVQTVSQLFFPFRFKIFQLPPIEMINCIVMLGNQFKMALDFLPEKEKEDLQLYFKEWIEISPGKFDEMLASVIEVDYDHEDINSSLLPLIDFLGITANLFERLDELELIGRKPDKNIFVREISGNQSAGSKKKGFSLLD